MRVLPSTRLGRAACWVALAFVLFFVANQAIVGLVGMRETSGWVRAALIAWGLAGFATGLAASLVALAALVRQRERSLLVFLTLVPGAFVLLFVAGEFLFPH